VSGARRLSFRPLELEVRGHKLRIPTASFCRWLTYRIALNNVIPGGDDSKVRIITIKISGPRGKTACMGLPAEMNFSFLVPTKDDWRLTFVRSVLTDKNGKTSSAESALNRQGY
jgi:hypothetical protein